MYDPTFEFDAPRYCNLLQDHADALADEWFHNTDHSLLELSTEQLIANKLVEDITDIEAEKLEHDFEVMIIKKNTINRKLFVDNKCTEPNKCQTITDENINQNNNINGIISYKNTLTSPLKTLFSPTRFIAPLAPLNGHSDERKSCNSITSALPSPSKHNISLLSPDKKRVNLGPPLRVNNTKRKIGNATEETQPRRKPVALHFCAVPTQHK
jgi:hypothetical protein